MPFIVLDDDKYLIRTYVKSGKNIILIPENKSFPTKVGNSCLNFNKNYNNIISVNKLVGVAKLNLVL